MTERFSEEELNSFIAINQEGKSIIKTKPGRTYTRENWEPNGILTPSLTAKSEAYGNSLCNKYEPRTHRQIIEQRKMRTNNVKSNSSSRNKTIFTNNSAIENNVSNEE